MDYLLHILIMIGIYIILTSSLNLVMGYTGLLSISHAAFYGLGAYAAALMALSLHTPFLLNALCAILLAGVLGAMVGIASLRIKDDYLVIATFALQVIAYSILNNWVTFTHRSDGTVRYSAGRYIRLESGYHLGLPCPCCASGCPCIMPHPAPDKLPLRPRSQIYPRGRGIRVSYGQNGGVYKVLILIVGASLAAAAGVVYAHYISFIDPSSFTVMESIFIISIVIIGALEASGGPSSVRSCLSCFPNSCASSVSRVRWLPTSGRFCTAAYF